MATEILNIATQYTLYNAYTVLTLGIIGNTINLLVFTQLKLFRGNRSAFYFIVETISNLFYEFISLSLTILTSIYGDDATGRSDVWCKIKFMAAQSGLLITYFMICSAAADQYFSTHYNYKLREMCTMKLARWTASIMIILWTGHSIAFALFFNALPSTGCNISNQIALRYATYFFYPALAGFIPITTSSLFSLFAFRNVRRIIRRQTPIGRRQLDRQMTAMVLLRVIFFFCLIFPYSFYRIYAINYPVSKSQAFAYAVAQLLQAVFLSLVRINSGVKFSFFLLIIRISMRFDFLIGKFLYFYDIISTFSSSIENCFGEKMLETMEKLLLLLLF